MQIKPTSYRLSLICTIVILSVLFFFGGPSYQSPRSFKAFWNLGHLIYFSLLPVLLFSFTKRRKTEPTIQAFIVISITLVIGSAVELLQYGFGRTPDFGDIFRDMIGALIAIFFLLPIEKSIRNSRLLMFKIVIIALVVSQFLPIAIALIDEYHARKDFPVLSDFQTPFQMQRWEKNADVRIEYISDHPGNRALKVDLTTAQYSGISLKYFPENWQHYKYFQYRIYNPVNEPINITCRIHDRKHTKGLHLYQDRFNKTYTIPQDWHTIVINLKEVQNAPSTRQMDLTQIRGIGLFAIRLPHPRTIYIDDLKLSQQSQP